MRRGVLVVALLLGGCTGTVSGDVAFGFDRQALSDLGVASLRVEVLDWRDAEGAPLDCQRITDQHTDTGGFVPLAGSRIVEVAGNALSVTVGYEELPLGIAFFLVVGFDEAAAGGSIVAAGCGQAAITAGEKPTVVVAMEGVGG